VKALMRKAGNPDLIVRRQAKQTQKLPYANFCVCGMLTVHDTMSTDPD
jgi:hypothetical protein